MSSKTHGLIFVQIGVNCLVSSGSTLGKGGGWTRLLSVEMGLLYTLEEELVQEFDKEYKQHCQLPDGELYAKIAQSSTGGTTKVRSS